MSTADLKNDLIKVIVNTDDVSFLRQIRDFFKKHQVTTDWWDEISDYEKEMIEIGAKEIEEGKVVPHEEVRAEINKMLRKN
jgi:predicted transcriptional regulator